MRNRIKERLKNGIERFLPFLRVRCDLRSFRYQYLERRIPSYILPDPLCCLDGTRVDSSEIWFECRRPELLDLFKAHMYGHGPSLRGASAHRVSSIDDCALADLAIRKEIIVDLDSELNSPKMTLLLYVPKDLVREGLRAPVFLGLNFFGNHTIHNDPGIAVTNKWIPVNSVTQGRPPYLFRGIQSSSWPLEHILKHGYGIATAYCGDIVPDREDGLKLGGVHRWFFEKGQFSYVGNSWGAIGGWAWGLSRAADYLENDPDIDPRKIILIGHSRLGKAALWAGAQDQRFSIVISNESGCGGAALSKRRFGETVAMINTSFPHWFCDHFKQYNNREEALPIDQHELISLIAPRPVYVASAELDLKSDPYGEFLATQHASAVYQLLGTSGLPINEFPPVNAPIMGTLGYHIRSGLHGISAYDWAQYIKFAGMHLKNRQNEDSATNKLSRKKTL